MSKLIITHKNPDPDAIASVWLLKRFDKDFEEATVKFVGAGDTYQNQKVDSDPDIVHVDTGFGKFDHHDSGERTCGAKKILDYLGQKFIYLKTDSALGRLVEIIIEDDHFEQCYWPEANNDRYAFWLNPILDGLKRSGKVDDLGLVKLGMLCLDGIYASLKIKVEAEGEIRKQGVKFETQWGKGLGIKSKNDEVLKVAQKSGYILAVRKDPDGMLRIKAQPKSKVDLTKTYEILKQKDPKASWFLHASKKMLLNGSYAQPDMVASRLGLEEVIEILKAKKG